MNIILIGYTTKIRDLETVHNHVSGPKLPSNYKTEEAIEKWKNTKLADAKRNWEATAPWVKPTGSLASVYAVDLVSKQVFDSAFLTPADDTLSAGARFSNWLLECYEFLLHPEHNYRPQPLIFYGFDPKPCLRLAGMDAIRAGIETPLGLWYQNDSCYDPKEMLLETEVKKQVHLYKLLEEAPEGPIEVAADYAPHQNPTEDVRVATELCFRYQLIPAYKEGPLRQMIDEGLAPWEDQGNPDTGDAGETPQTEDKPEASRPIRKKAAKKPETSETE